MTTKTTYADNRMILVHTDTKVIQSADQLQASHGTIIHTTQVRDPVVETSRGHETLIRGLTPDQARELAKALNEAADQAEAQTKAERPLDAAQIAAEDARRRQPRRRRHSL